MGRISDIRQDAGAQRRLRPRVRETVEPPRSETQSVITRRGRKGLRTDAAPPEESGTVSADNQRSIAMIHFTQWPYM